MSIYASANNQYLQRTTGTFPTDTTACSGLLWAQLNASCANFGLWGYQFSGGGYLYLYNLFGDGVTAGIQASGASGGFVDGPAMALGTWYCFAWSCNGTGALDSIHFNYRSATQKTWTTGTCSQDFAEITSVTSETLLANAFSATSSTFLGRVAGLRTWTSVLTDDQLLRESFSPTPIVRPFAWYPLDRMITGADASGNGRNMTITGAVTLAETPSFLTPFRSVLRAAKKAILATRRDYLCLLGVS